MDQTKDYTRELIAKAHNNDKEAKRAKPKKKEPKTHKYYFRMYTESDPEDGKNV